LITGQGGPARGIDDYDESASAIDAFWGHAEHKASDLKDFLAVNVIQAFLADENKWKTPRQGWTPEFRQGVLAHARRLVSKEMWKTTATAMLKTVDRAEF
jgi:hypothetical protein